MRDSSGFDHCGLQHLRPHQGNSNWYANWQTPLLACALRLLIIPLAILGIARVLPLPENLLKIAIIQAAMPSGIFPIVLTRIYKGDTTTALRVVISTTLVSFLTIPFWIQFGLRFLNITP